MVDPADADRRRSGQDGRVDEDRTERIAGTGTVEELIIHGRDREATELAARQLRDRHSPGPTPTRPPPTPGGTPMGPLAQIDELEPLLGGIAAGIAPDQLDAPTPCSEYRVRDVLGHMIGGATQFAAAFHHEPAPEVPADVAEGPDVVARAGGALGNLLGAIREPGALDQTVASPFGDLPGDVFARFVVLDGLVHGWDLATATGQEYAPSDALVGAVDGFARQAIAPEWRGGPFAEAVEPPATASPIERLAAFTGRQV
jgi:uncharacterized protein (TIGR03086 family)